ncbi:MAG: malto-oligosyltrehalose synthase, partial [Thermomicrobiales bacterium]|nr:malto-oligosyltrehalose synthase [Thermomicrobiales bacterium]
VPNHMGIGHGVNLWWQDVLENGQASEYADFFDIDWAPLKRELRGKVLLPILGDHFGVVLEQGELNLHYADGSFVVSYFDTPLPLAPPTYPIVLRVALPTLESALPPDDPSLLEFLSIITAFERLPPTDERDPDALDERRREQIVGKRRLADLVAASRLVARALDDAITRLNGTAGDPRSFDALDELLDEQPYRLAFFRTAADEINYRRFFAINELAAVRQEEPEVFARSHALLLATIADGRVTGVRVDHPDGLWDPAGYMRALQEQAAKTIANSGGRPAPEHVSPGSDPGDALPLYLVVEKILEPGETLPEDWDVHGTVGYEFARVVTGLFVDSANRKAFDELYVRYTGQRESFANLVFEKKNLIMEVALASEVNVLARALNRISEQDRRTRDFTLERLRDAVRETIACFPVYRTYTVCDGSGVSESDRRTIERAIALAKRRNPAVDASVFDFLRDVLLLRHPETATSEQVAQRCRFAMKFQQLTGPVMAKGVEDTAFYIYNRLTSLNEVGGAPDRFGATVAEFHRDNSDHLRRWPHGLLAASTHDAKRGEDVRTRIDTLSEMPRAWRTAIDRWTRLNRKARTKIDGEEMPERATEYLFYQTLLGTWPFGMTLPDEAFIARIDAYMLKAVREAQVRTSWINPDAAYEAALRRFVGVVLDPAVSTRFLDEFQPLQVLTADLGAINSLAQHALRLAAPGVPDIYQGSEFWDLSLVDPDNRRPVDFAARETALRDLASQPPSVELAAELFAARADGRIKLYLTLHGLQARLRQPEVFAHGDYLPLAAAGAQQEHLVAFARVLGGRQIVVAAPRLIGKLTDRGNRAPLGADAWEDTMLIVPKAAAGARYRDILTGQVAEVGSTDGAAMLPLACVFATLPVAVLERIEEGRGDEPA